jgi:hypothetical protein
MKKLVAVTFLVSISLLFLQKKMQWLFFPISQRKKTGFLRPQWQK